MLNSTGYYCKSQTTPFVPYYLSGLDFLAWRFGVPEMVYPEALIPGMREIRANGDTWGNIYPRAGTVTQVHDYKASAVTAHRVADVVTNTFQPHVYIPIAKKDNQSNGEWFPPPVKEGDEKTHKWQQLHPVTSQSCAIFPDNPPSMLSEMVVMPGHYGALTSAVKNADKHFCIVLIGLINKGIEYEIKSCTESILYCYIVRNLILNHASISFLIVIRLDLIKPILFCLIWCFIKLGAV